MAGWHEAVQVVCPEWRALVYVPSHEMRSLTGFDQSPHVRQKIDTRKVAYSAIAQQYYIITPCEKTPTLDRLVVLLCNNGALDYGSPRHAGLVRDLCIPGRGNFPPTLFVDTTCIHVPSAASE